MNRNAFFLPFLILFGTSFVTLIEALKTTNNTVRHILNLETSVSLIAGYVYSIFLQQIDKGESYKSITRYRYYDWVITTPMLILSLIMFLCLEQGVSLPLHAYLVPILLNYMMLLFGYLGETSPRSNKMLCGLLGFFWFFMMIAYLFFNVIKPGAKSVVVVVFVLFSVIWSMYGVAFYLPEEQKNIMYNVLDVISKALFGIFCWVYYARIFV